jgi:hypothetical protein
MRALSKLIFGGDKYYGQADGKLQGIYPGPDMLKMGMTGADFSNKNLERVMPSLSPPGSPPAVIRGR